MIETARIYFLVTVVAGGLFASTFIPTEANTRRLTSLVIALVGIAWLLSVLTQP
jgi:hypothetical protein